MGLFRVEPALPVTAVKTYQLTQQMRTPVTQLRRKAAELMSRVGHGQRLGIVG